MISKKLVVLLSILLLSVGVLVFLLNKTSLYAPTPSGKLGRTDPFTITKYPNVANWKEIMTDAHHKSITFTTSDSEQLVFLLVQTIFI